MNKKEKIFVAGSGGMVGSAIVRQLELVDKYEIITMKREHLDLTNQNEVKKFFCKQRNQSSLFGSCKSWGYIRK